MNIEHNKVGGHSTFTNAGQEQHDPTLGWNQENIQVGILQVDYNHFQAYQLLFPQSSWGSEALKPMWGVVIK